MKKSHFEAEIAFPKFSEVRDTVKIPKTKDSRRKGQYRHGVYPFP